MGRALDGGSSVLKYPGGKQASGKAVCAPGLLGWPAVGGSSAVSHPGYTAVVSAQEWDRHLLDLDTLGSAVSSGLSVRKKPVVVQMQNLVIWCNGIDAVKVYDPSTGNVYSLGIADPAAAPGVADQGSGSFAGEYLYWIRWKRSTTGEYSALSAETAHTSSGSGAYNRVTWTNPAISGVDYVEIFRSKSGKHGIYYIGQEAVATELWDDNVADTAIDITLVPPSLPAPGGSATVPVFDYIATYKGRLWGMVKSTNKIYWSPPHAPWLIPATSARSLPATRDEGTGFAVSGESLYVSQRRHLFMVSNIISDTDTGEIIPELLEIDDSTGFASQHAVCSVENTLFFLSGDGKVYQTAGTSVAQERAPQLEETLKRLFTKRLDEAVAGYAEHERKIYLGVSVDESSYNNLALVLDATTGAWSVADIPMESIHEYRDSDGRGRMCFGTIRGDICQIGVGNGYGARKGTLSGSPTSGTINSLADTSASFDADLAGLPITLFDRYYNVLQTNQVLSRDSATALTTVFRWDIVPNTTHHYVIGGCFPEWKFGWIDANDHAVFRYARFGFRHGRGKAGFYIGVDDGLPELVDVVNFSDGGHHESYPMIGGKRFQPVIRGFDGAAPFGIVAVEFRIE